MLAFSVLQNLPVLLPNPGCWQRNSFQGQWDILWVVPDGFAVYSDPAMGSPTEKGLACCRFPVASIGAIAFIFNLLPLICRIQNCTWKSSGEFVTWATPNACLCFWTCLAWMQIQVTDVSCKYRQAKREERQSAGVNLPGVWLKWCGLYLQKPLRVLTGCH